ncbi:hypothetical protein ABZU25_04780 [Micromonospora sp. NPDC005215]|uniref:hypothetical protein n=1 Tax=Micromonospora sp. NPDC005215 TaxID=3157024 RepID=UPI0033BCED71
MSQLGYRTALAVTKDGEYVADTGPLLCLGYSKQLRDHVKRRWGRKTHWVDAVRQELALHAKKYDAKGRAAQYFGGTAARWLVDAPPVDDADIPKLNALLARLKALELEKSAITGRRVKTGSKANLGEAESILFACQQGHTLLAHDNDAKKVAREVGVPAGTVVDLARWLVAQGANVAELGQSLLDLQATDIDSGERISGVLDLVPRQRRF